MYTIQCEIVENTHSHRFDLRKHEKKTMATDTKRIPAPESTPYHLPARQKSKSYQEKLAITLESGQRKDKRKFEEARKICKRNIFD